ncbi:MAG: M15 family metallopeptidase [Bdellovibrionaceae bacterium]|nr:M15 family metallopeptidase [Pseudobdellovibrionaceae bacterium]
MKLGPEFIDVSTLPQARIDLRYASENNFMKRNVYGSFVTAYLHRIAFEKLRHAGQALEGHRPGWKLLVFDALRPRSAQKILFAFVEGTDQEPYIAPPVPGSIHNFGMAVDLSLLDERGEEVDMGTPFDDFRELAQPRHEERFLASGHLTPQHVENRRFLRSLMLEAGFLGIPHEWWHFEALPRDQVRDHFIIVE